MSTYAIGDIQGCLEPLKRLLDQVNFDPAEDRLWIAGDLINRGPSSQATLSFLYPMRDRLSVVLGNHDLHLIAVARGHRPPNRKDTLEEILGHEEHPEWIEWLRHRPLLHHDPELDYVMTHAGIPPQWSLERAKAHAREVEAVLQSTQLDDFLSQMYGNEPSRWKPKLYGVERLRLITNYFTRMRFCTADGELDLDNKGGAESHAPGFEPWFAHPERKCRDQKIIFGHWAALEGKVDAPNVFALDTGCVWGGTLTALRLEDQRRFECEC
ncbi:symmetrical bis(5'-nucleosyl)-tetraphosphatase [Marinimicrobium locisalis]|uniref:symmetrical bis(5'-nucleosyl)-tetraphosphatase n=1 Tax=Marinimicrobium locisalis TaxID=546022 RepID=UPI0032214495